MGFLEMIRTCEKRLQSVLLDYLHLIMEKAIHYQWPAVRNFHAAISSAMEQKRLTWLEIDQNNIEHSLFTCRSTYSS